MLLVISSMINTTLLLRFQQIFIPSHYTGSSGFKTSPDSGTLRYENPIGAL
jgi:hypothetical protein